MNTSQFQSDRRDALRQQLVELPTLPGAEDPGRYRPGKTVASQLRQSVLPADAHAALEVSPPVRRPSPTRRILITAAAAVVGALVVGQISITAQSAHAAGVLRAAADQSMTFVDPAPGPGQYLLVSTHANWSVSGIDQSGKMTNSMNVQTIDVYRPGNPTEDWVLRRDWGDGHPVPMEIEVIRAKDGYFYGGPWTLSDDELAALPRDGQALYDHFNAGYQGGSASRDENNFVRITDILRMGLIPADLRAGLYDALALIPGVTASEQANFDGKVGIAIGRTEPLRAGQRAEMIIDPTTGLVIGERTIMTYAAFGFGSNEVTGHTAIDYRVVDSAPQ